MATARLRPQMMRLTDAAADRIKSVMANAGRPIVGVRVGVKNGGCPGMAYTMEYAEQVEPSDEVVEDKGVRVGVDYKDINVLDDPRVREGIKSYTNWPTIPQFYGQRRVRRRLRYRPRDVSIGRAAGAVKPKGCADGTARGRGRNPIHGRSPAA